MQENTQNYKESDLKFSSSKLYFQHQNQILQKIWFISPMTIDLHFLYTFQEIHENYFIEGGEFEWFTVEHNIHEQWIIYKIWLSKPKFQNIKYISLDLKKSKLNQLLVWSLVWWLFWRCIVFWILSWLYSKWEFWKVLFWLNIIGWGILILFCLRKISKVVYNKYFKTKNVDYLWFNINYSDQTDALMLSHDIVDILKKMKNEFWITNFCYTGNCIYLLQDIHDREWKKLSSSNKLYTEQEKANLQQRTLEFIHQSDFLSYFI